jgi:hypothetical protein
MITPIRLVALAAAGLSLAACANKPIGEMPTAAAKPAAPAAKPAPAQQADQPPMDRAEANAQCWMKYDRTNVSLEAKAKLVDKCATEKLSGK